MAGRAFRSDYVDLAAVLMVIVGALDVLQGLIAIIRGSYFEFDPNGILIVDLFAWGFSLLFGGFLVAATGVGLWFRSSAARWFAVGVAAVNIVGELGFAGGTQWPLWALVVIALDIFILYALIVHWHGAEVAQTEPRGPG